MKNSRCNWEYTGKYDTNKQGSIKSMKWMVTNV